MDINDPKVKKELETEVKAFYEAVRGLRELEGFKLYIKRLEDMAEYTKDKVMGMKDYEDIVKLQVYYQFLNDLLMIAHAEDQNIEPDAE